MRHSVNDFNRAMKDVDTSVQQQNIAVEQMNYDVVDLVNQIMEHPVGPPIPFTPLRTPQDVAHLMAQCAAKMRIIRAHHSRSED